MGSGRWVLLALVSGCGNDTVALDGGADASVDAPSALDASTDAPAMQDATSDVVTEAGPKGFVHPGILLGKAQLDFIKQQLTNQAAPQTAANTKMMGSHFAALNHVDHPAATLTRNTSAATDIADDDIAAYTDALAWYFTGNAAYADEAITIMNDWSGMLTSVDSTGQLDAAWASEMFPRAAEIIRYTYKPASGHPSLDVTAFATMLTKVLLPQLDPTSDGATFSNGNWELSMAEGTMNIGIFTDDETVFQQGVAMWRARVPAYIYETSDGAVPVFPPGGKYSSSALVTCFWATGGQHTTTCTLPPGFAFHDGMVQETCRDMSHVILGMEAMIFGAETARIQSVDLYGEQEKRIVDAYEFTSKYDLQAIADGNGTTGAIQDSTICGGSLNFGGTGYTLGFEAPYNAYATRLSQTMPFTLQMVNKLRPTPAALHIAWESLTFPGTP